MEKNEMVFEFMKSIAPAIVQEGLKLQNQICATGANPEKCTVGGMDIPHAFAESARIWAEALAEKCPSFTIIGIRDMQLAKLQTEAIDLGLPSGTKWANMNLGANAPEETGLYYSWGNIEGHVAGGDYDFYDEYENSPGSKLTGDIDLEHDAAHALLGGNWQMPTTEDFVELVKNCESEWTTCNGQLGRKFTSKINGNSVFFPAAGYYYGTTLYNRGAYGYYWASTLYSSANGRYLNFYSSGVDPQRYSNRFFGFSVRAVQKFA